MTTLRPWAKMNWTQSGKNGFGPEIRATALKHTPTGVRPALYLDVADRKPLRAVDAFRHASGLRPQAAEAWLARLRAVGEAEVMDLIVRVPGERCSAVAKDFATRIVRRNRARLLGIED
jgi:hypothetical protein